MSGGAIFARPKDYPYYCEWHERKLTGIFHTYKEADKILIGSAMLPFLAAITLGQIKGFGGYQK